MNVAWVLAEGFVLDPLFDIEQLKSIGSFWGGWRTWRSNATDNVVCFDQSQASDLIARSFHKNCNLFIPKSAYQFLNRPSGVKMFDGEFQHDVEHKDDIISMHLASGQSDIILLLGFDFSEQQRLEDRLLEHQAHNYRQLTKQVILSNPEVQWVLIDHPISVRKDLIEVSNLTSDTLTNVIDMLSS